MKKSIGSSILDYFRLVTVLSDIQLAINCRPLTYRCSDNFSLEVLTPNHFLKPNVETNLFFRDVSELLHPSNVCKTLVKSLELREKILLNFKRLWYEEYLLSLKESYRNLFDSNFSNKVKEGDIVLVKNRVLFSPRTHEHCSQEILKIWQEISRKYLYFGCRLKSAQYNSMTSFI